MYTELQIFLVSIYQIHGAIVLKSGSPNLLKPTMPVQAGTKIPLP
jgi:hypothetical protein